MIIGLVLGKFYPLHSGHIGLITYAEEHCDELFVLICASEKESIAGSVRLHWLEEQFAVSYKIKPLLINYFEEELPNTSISSKDVSKIWATKILTILPKVDIVFSSEPYGDYLAEFLCCDHMSYDGARKINNISAKKIRQNIFKSWDEIAASAKPYFVKKVCISGTESTGKSTLTERLATYYRTEYVPEMAREILKTTDECTQQNLLQIAELHADTINQKLKTANKFLFIDTDINITRSYSKFLFGHELISDKWVEQANQFDLYLYLDNDSVHIQDGTRLDKQRRDQLNLYHQKELRDRGIKFELISGNWEERFMNSISIINKFFDLKEC